MERWRAEEITRELGINGAEKEHMFAEESLST